MYETEMDNPRSSTHRRIFDYSAAIPTLAILARNETSQKKLVETLRPLFAVRTITDGLQFLRARGLVEGPRRGESRTLLYRATTEGMALALGTIESLVGQMLFPEPPVSRSRSSTAGADARGATAITLVVRDE